MQARGHKRTQSANPHSGMLWNWIAFEAEIQFVYWNRALQNFSLANDIVKILKKVTSIWPFLYNAFASINAINSKLHIVLFRSFRVVNFHTFPTDCIECLRRLESYSYTISFIQFFHFLVLTSIQSTIILGYSIQFLFSLRISVNLSEPFCSVFMTVIVLKCSINSDKVKSEFLPEKSIPRCALLQSCLTLRGRYVFNEADQAVNSSLDSKRSSAREDYVLLI